MREKETELQHESRLMRMATKLCHIRRQPDESNVVFQRSNRKRLGPNMPGSGSPDQKEEGGGIGKSPIKCYPCKQRSSGKREELKGGINLNQGWNVVHKRPVVTKHMQNRCSGFYMMIAGTSTLALMDLWGRTLPPLT